MENAIGLAGFLATLGGMYLGWRQYRLSGRQAKKELRLKSPIDVFFYRSHAEMAVWILPWPTGERQPVQVDLQFALINHDEESIQDIMVQMEISSLCYVPELERGVSGAGQAVKMERFHDPVQGAEKTRVHYNVPFLHPEVAYVVTDDIFIPFPSRINQEVRGRTKDDVEVVADTTFTFGWTIDLRVAAKDRPVVTRSFSVFAFPPDDDDVSAIDRISSPLAILSAAGWNSAASPPRRALVFKISQFSSPPADMPDEIAALVRVARVADAERVNATYFKGIGYLPIQMSADGSFTLDPRLSRNQKR